MFRCRVPQFRNSEGKCPCAIVDSAVNKGRQPAKKASYWPIFGRLLSSHSIVNFGKKLKIRKRSKKNNCETFVKNV